MRDIFFALVASWPVSFSLSRDTWRLFQRSCPAVVYWGYCGAGVYDQWKYEPVEAGDQLVKPRDREVSIPWSALADKRGALEVETFIRDGELTPELERQWDALAGTEHEKLYRLGLAVCGEQAVVAALDHEIERLTERRRAKQKRIDHRKAFLQEHLERLGLRRVEGPLCTVTLHKNSALSVEELTDPHAGPQPDLFASRPTEAHSTRTGIRRVRESHVRVY